MEDLIPFDIFTFYKTRRFDKATALRHFKKCIENHQEEELYAEIKERIQHDHNESVGYLAINLLCDNYYFREKRDEIFTILKSTAESHKKDSIRIMAMEKLIEHFFYLTEKRDEIFTILKSTVESREKSSIKIFAMEKLIEHFFERVEEIVHKTITSEEPLEFLHATYKLLETVNTPQSVKILRWMENKIGGYYLNRYEIHPREALGLEFLGRECILHCHERIKHWDFEFSEVNNGSLTRLLLEYTYDILRSKYLEFFPNLEELVLVGCIIDDFSVLTGLKKLAIYGSEEPILESIDQINKIETFANLEALKLSKNRISEIMNLERLINLKKLDLSENRIKEIKGFDKLKNLEELDLRGNFILEISGLESLEHLKILRLDRNEIAEIKGIGTLRNLEFFSISDNKFKAIPGLPSIGNEREGVSRPQEFVKYCKNQ